MGLSDAFNEADYSDNVDTDHSIRTSQSYNDQSPRSFPCDSIAAKFSALNDLDRHVSDGISYHYDESFKPSKQKSRKDLECEESLRRLHSLTVGDNIYFRRSTIAACSDSGDDTDGFVEGKVTCFTYTSSTRYVVVMLEGFGYLKFTLGDIYSMSIDHHVHLQRLQHSTSLSKSLRQKRHRFESDDEFATRRYWNGMNKSLLTDESDSFSGTDGVSETPYRDIPSSSSQYHSEASDVKTRPIPPGAESFCRCRFVNKLDIVRKLRKLIADNKECFMEKTAEMTELRLIQNHNVRAYEVEVVAYLLGEDPWKYAANPQDKPKKDQINTILEQYRAAARDPDYLNLYEQWQEYQNSVKGRTKMHASVSS
ncbi:hypothetical protein BBOV_II005870 [Babesia bovis T2Bo]|uniref:Uncharacterized protein n=1 Tax=Babesia bovis TaxID=5865 RepID=A7AUC6_BABBO|nr:hypothetical protein BBOV_II005870 [Babesia bovis T2Bo]EDO06537.1 hypothetical protein BBOV_II005870 [Babesia bovis T2Bo]BAN64609.1 hypothetical protein [Babesia bovis]|eukprot:XP_001610105.1 hypothetical protein [Babesia bovis T2Bo]